MARSLYAAISLFSLIALAGSAAAVPIGFSMDVVIITDIAGGTPPGSYPSAGSFSVDSALIPGTGTVSITLTDFSMSILAFTSASDGAGPQGVFVDGSFDHLSGQSLTGGIATFDLLGPGTIFILEPFMTIEAAGTYSVSQVPEPGTGVLACLTLASMAGVRRRAARLGDA